MLYNKGEWIIRTLLNFMHMFIAIHNFGIRFADINPKINSSSLIFVMLVIIRTSTEQLHRESAKGIQWIWNSQYN